MNIGNRLQKLLDEDGLTQRELAEELAVSPTTLNGYIKNRRQPDARTVILLAAYFCTTTDYIFGRTNTREPEVFYYDASERYLVDIYREIPEEYRTLYFEIGKVFNEYSHFVVRQMP